VSNNYAALAAKFGRQDLTGQVGNAQARQQGQQQAAATAKAAAAKAQADQQAAAAQSQQDEADYQAAENDPALAQIQGSYGTGPASFLDAQGNLIPPDGYYATTQEGQRQYAEVQKWYAVWRARNPNWGQ
jgi:hypothetical protein